MTNESNERAVIIGVSGRKKSGKSTLAKAISDQVNGYRLAFADPIKTFCVDVLGLNPEYVYGTDDEKENLTNYTWGRLPHFEAIALEYRNHRYPEHFIEERRNRLMTYRQILQEVGTGMMRAFGDNVLVDVAIRRIKQVFAAGTHKNFVIDDVRFPNEVTALVNEGGYLIRLERGVRGDTHVSETSLDNWENWNLKIDNRACSAAEAADTAFKNLTETGLLAVSKPVKETAKKKVSSVNDGGNL